MPEELRAPDGSKPYDTDENFFKRWDYVLEQMIFAFENKVKGDWEDRFHKGESDLYFERIEGTSTSEMKKGPNHTREIDLEGIKEYQARISNGFRLFGKYYEALWT